MLTRLSAHVGNVSALAFSRDDAILFTGGGDGALKVWDLDRQGTAEDARALACSLVGHGLDQDEWSSYVGQLPFRESCP